MRAAAIALLSFGCCFGGVSGSDCETVIDEILICDPSAASVRRATLAIQCSGTSPACVGMDVTTPAGCAAFMGCLYGD